jgi:hypothetical protein
MGAVGSRSRAGIDGNAIAQILMKEQPKLPVVLWSSSLDEIPESLKWYADELLKKTDGPEALISALARLLNRGIATEKAVVGRTFAPAERLVA